MKNTDSDNIQFEFMMSPPVTQLFFFVVYPYEHYLCSYAQKGANIGSHMLLPFHNTCRFNFSARYIFFNVSRHKYISRCIPKRRVL
jgi:hypothetical protein